MTGPGPSAGEFAVLLDQLIQEVTGIATSIDGGFFEAGLTSVQLICVLDRLQSQLGRELPVTDLFRFPSRRALARRLAEMAGAAPESRSSTPVSPTGPHTAQNRRALRAQIRDATGTRQG
jgi:hypothetical protein